LKLPFPILTLSHPPPTAGISGTQYDGQFPSLFNVCAEMDEEEYKVGDSEDELVSTPSSPELKPIRMSTVAPAFGSSTRTVWDMPMRGSRDAPKTFRGQHTKVEYFVAHYDKLLVKYRVTAAYDQCECILDYCSADVRGFIRASEHYQNRDWPRF
jgi:hypothetical protein